MSEKLHKERISLPTAVQARLKGYDEFTGYYVVYTESQVDPEYPEGGGPFGFNEGEIEEQFGEFYSNRLAHHEDSGETSWFKKYAAPRRQQLSDWLREEKKIMVVVSPERAEDQFVFSVHFVLNGEWTTQHNSSIIKRYNEAFENALSIALDMLPDSEEEFSRPL